jgi:hypothetical protein
MTSVLTGLPKADCVKTSLRQKGYACVRANMVSLQSADVMGTSVFTIDKKITSGHSMHRR